MCASEEVRKGRGWEWTEGVDDAPSECALDNYTCQMLLSNEGDDISLTKQLEEIHDFSFGRLNA